MALCDSHSGFHWLSRPLSGILWPSLAHYCSRISHIQILIGSQGPCLALIADATMTHFIPLWCEPIVFQRNHFVQGKRNIGKYINHHVFVQFWKLGKLRKYPCWFTLWKIINRRASVNRNPALFEIIKALFSILIKGTVHHISNFGEKKRKFLKM